MKDAVTRLSPADVVFAAVSPDEVIEAIRAIRASGYNGPIVGGDGYDLGLGWKQALDIGGVYFTTHAYLGDDNNDARVRSFRTAMLEAYPGHRPDAFSALGYDTANLVIAAIRRAGSDNPGRVLSAIAETRNFEGVTGTISYTGGSHIPRKTVAILKIDHGQVSLAARFVPAKPPTP